MLNLDSIFFGFKHKSVGNPPRKSHPKTNMDTQNDDLEKGDSLLKKNGPSLDIYMKTFWNQSICWEPMFWIPHQFGGTQAARQQVATQPSLPWESIGRLVSVSTRWLLMPNPIDQTLLPLLWPAPRQNQQAPGLMMGRPCVFFGCIKV